MIEDYILNRINSRSEAVPSAQWVTTTKSSRGFPSIHADPSIVNRLVRLLEELLERDYLIPDADITWYRNKLAELKMEISDAEDTSEAAHP